MDNQFQLYQRKATWINLRPYVLGEDMSLISVSSTDIPEEDMGYIAQNPDNFDDQWYIAKDFADKNYQMNLSSGEEPDETVDKITKTLGNTDANGASKNVSDIVFWGDGDTFKLISKASSQNEGWMKSTKAMDVGNGAVVQVTTQQRNPDGGYSVAEALTYVPNVKIEETFVTEGDFEVITSRRLTPLS